VLERRVVAVLDGETFEVDPRWDWNGQTGTKVRSRDCNVSEAIGGSSDAAEDRLAELILGDRVELEPRHILGDRLVCDVFLDGKSLATHYALQ